MEEILLILAKTVELSIAIVVFAMVVRMIMPLLFDIESSRIYLMCCLITEPVIMPVRFLMMKLNIGQNSPIDWSFFATYMILWLIRTILPAI